jgi:two-component system, response regulator YesN
MDLSGFGAPSRGRDKLAGPLLFRKFFLSYAAVLLVPCAIGLALYAVAVGSISRSARGSNQAILEQTRDIVDDRVAELDSMARQFSLNDEVHALLAKDAPVEGDPSYYDFWTFWKSLPNYALTDSFISSSCLVSRRSGFILSPEQITRKGSAGYRREFRYSSWSAEEWNDYLFSAYRSHELLPCSSASSGDLAPRGAYYVQSLVSSATRRPEGAFVAFIDESSIRGLLRRLDTGDRGLILVSDARGRVVARSAGASSSLVAGEVAAMAARGELGKLERSGYIVSRASSRLTGWQFVSALPSKMVLAPALRIRNIALAILAVGLLVGLGIAAALARRSSQPVAELATRFSELARKDEDLSRELELQAPVMRAEFARRLLLGLYGSESEASELAARAELEGRDFAPALLRIEGYPDSASPELQGELRILRAAITEGLRGSSDLSCLAYEPDATSVAALFLAPRGEEGARASELLLGSLAERLAEGFRARLSWSRGESVARLQEIPPSFARARGELERRGSCPSTAASGAPRPGGDDSFRFPVESELRLVAALNRSDAAALRDIMAEVARENLEERSLSDEAFEELGSALRLALLRGPRSSLEAARELAAADSSDRRGWFAAAGGLLEGLCAGVASARMSERRELAEAIARRVAELSSDPSLTIYAVAREFGLSESSFYHFFKANFGASFADYLESIRIAGARELLRSSGASIKDISLAVGFASDTTFRRAFHRSVGVSPSEYLRASSSGRERAGIARSAQETIVADSRIEA